MRPTTRSAAADRARRLIACRGGDPTGRSARALHVACQHDTPALSAEVWNELTEVLDRPRLARFIDAAARDDVLTLI